MTDGSAAATSDAIATDVPSTSSSSDGTNKRKFQPLALPTPETIMQQDMQDNCAVKSIISAGAGGVFGVMFGIFAVSMETGNTLDPITGDAIEKSTRQLLKETFVSMKQKSWSYAKSFAYMGLLFSGTECVIEKYRAKHDKWNAIYSGCVVGGVMAHKAGPQAMCAACAGFAAFSAAIEHFMDGH